MTKAAAGVAQLEEALNQVHIRKGMLAQLYCETMFTEIATTKWFDGLECGTRVKVLHEPDFNFRKYEKDQELEFEQPKVCTTEFGADFAYYAAVKFDDLDKKHVCRYNELRPAFERSIRRKANELIEDVVFQHIYQEAHYANQGNNAGALGNYALGQVGAPYIATPESLFDLMLSNGGVLDDQCAPMTQRWIVFPTQFKMLFAQGILGKTILNGSCSLCPDARNGKMYEDLSGFDIYFSSRLPQCVDPITGEIAWIIPFGQKDGMGYTADIGEFMVDRPFNTFGEVVKVLITFGAGTGRPEFIGFDYVTLGA